MWLGFIHLKGHDNILEHHPYIIMYINIYIIYILMCSCVMHEFIMNYSHFQNTLKVLVWTHIQQTHTKFIIDEFTGHFVHTSKVLA